ncbi:hypothetical protein M8J76_003686 [Diaphorina citri]|nr:hypothetical protein M8J75_002178 [Diaphorina citri]KAI5732744.1 hypothetical protein M8J76_003686 [Diaphorina citri]
MRFTSVLYRRVRKYVAADQVGELTKAYSNLPDRYINRVMRQVYHVYPKGPQYTVVDQGKDSDFDFSTDRPWEVPFLARNRPWEKNKKKIPIEPIKDWSIFKGDRVEILVGKDKGKQGYVIQIFQEINSVIVEGLNTYLKKMGDSQFIIKQEAPLLVTNEVALVDPSDRMGCQVEWRYTEAGDRVRVSKRSENEDKDTKEQDVLAVTYQPKLSTFEMDIMEEHKIEEDRVPAKSFWY